MTRLRPGPLGLWMAPVAYLGLPVLLVLGGMIGLAGAWGQVAQGVLTLLWVSALTWPVARRRSAQALGLSGGAGWARILGAALLGFALIAGITALLEAHSPQTAASTATVLSAIGAGQTQGTDLLLVLSIAGLTPLGEEALFRGLILRALYDGANRLGPGLARIALPGALLLSAALFTLTHGGDGQEGSVLLALFVQGLVYGALYALTGGLWAPALAHGMNNSWALLQHVRSGTPPDLDGLSIALALGGPLLIALGLALWRGLLGLAPPQRA